MTGVLIITDLHLRGENTKSEPCLLEDQQVLLNTITQLAITNRDKYEQLYCVFLGDITNTTVTGEMFTVLSFFLEDLNNICDHVYCVMGNHEFGNMKKGNLFWQYAYGDLPAMPKRVKIIRPLLRVENSIIIDDTYIKLWHYSQPWVDEENIGECKNTVVLSHNVVVTPEMKQLLNANKVDIKNEYITYGNLYSSLHNFNTLKYYACGHQHALIGRFRIEENYQGIKMDFIYEGLGSLGRPNSAEFNLPNKRNIPLLEIDGDSFIVRNNLIELTDRSHLDEREILIRQEKYQQGKYLKELRKMNFTSDNMAQTVRDLYAYDLQKLKIFDLAMKSEIDSELMQALIDIENLNIYG